MIAGGPGIGVVVVWSHHVGIITGQTPDGQWIVHSGNDGGAVHHPGPVACPRDCIQARVADSGRYIQRHCERSEAI